MNNSPDLKAQIAIAALKGDRTLLELAQQHGVQLWEVTEWTIQWQQRVAQAFGVESGNSVPKSDLDGRSSTNNGPMCFIHINKTAGTTLTSYLDDLFDVAKICPALFHHQLVKIAQTQNLKRFDLFHGHFFLSWLRNVELRSNTRYLTVLRHPLARVISTHNHWMRATVETVRHVSPLLSESNKQCLKLSPLPMRHNYASLREHLESAKEALEGFFFVGIQERFEESMRMLSWLLGRPAPGQIRKRNVASNELKELPVVLREEILVANWADLELYDYAMSLFNRRLSSLESLPCHKYFEGAPMMDTVNYRMSAPLYGDGWHEREGMGTEHPQLWRWSGPGTASYMDFKLNPNRDYQLSVRVVNAMAPDILESVQVLVNDSPIVLSQRRDDLWGILFEGIVPQSALVSTMPNTRVTFRVSRTLTHSEVNPNVPDHRRCGIAVTEINFVPSRNRKGSFWNLIGLKAA